MREGRFYAPITESAAAEIVKLTWPKGSPNNVNNEELADLLNYIFSGFERHRRLDLVATRQARKSIGEFATRMTKLEQDLTKLKHAAVLQAALILGGCEVGAAGEVYQALGLQPMDLDTPLVSIWSIDGGLREFDPRVEVTVPRLLTAVSLMKRWANAAVDAPVVMSRISAIEMLIGNSLPGFYKMYFGKRFGAGTAGGSYPNGPGIRFVRACLSAASVTRPGGEPYSNGTIRKYWANSQTLKFRRTPDKRHKNY
jgi:hypothetical protein